MKIITNGDGMAIPEHICDTHCSDFECYFEHEPNLPLIDQSGNEAKQAGEFEAELITQTRPRFGNFDWYSGNTGYDGDIEKRKVYRLTSPNVPLINKPDITQPIENEGGYKAETAEEAAKIEMGVSYDEHMSGSDQIFIKGAIFGAQWQASQSNLIDRDKVVEVFKWLLGYYDFPDAPAQGRAKYYWRNDLREKLKEIGIEITGNTSPFQPSEKGNLHE